MKWFRVIANALLAFCFFELSVNAHSEVYPGKPIRVIVPFPAGGATDIAARQTMLKLSEKLGVSIIIDNRGGAQGAIGTTFAARATPDGYTLLVNSGGAQILGSILYKAKYDALKDFEPISLIAAADLIFAVNPKINVNKFNDFVSLAKQGGAMSMASGSAMILIYSEYIKKYLGLNNIADIPYKGTMLQQNALISGEVDVAVLPPHAVPMIKNGKIKALATLSERRSASLPDIPSIKEIGYPNLMFRGWIAFFAPKGTPTEIVNILRNAMQEILKDEELKKQLAAAGYEVNYLAGDVLVKFISDEIIFWSNLVSNTNYKPQE